MRGSRRRYLRESKSAQGGYTVDPTRTGFGRARSETAKLRQQQVPLACLHDGSARTPRLLVVAPAASKSCRDEGGMPGASAAQARVARRPTMLRLQLRS